MSHARIMKGRNSESKASRYLRVPGWLVLLIVGIIMFLVGITIFGAIAYNVSTKRPLASMGCTPGKRVPFRSTGYTSADHRIFDLRFFCGQGIASSHGDHSQRVFPLQAILAGTGHVVDRCGRGAIRSSVKLISSIVSAQLSRSGSLLQTHPSQAGIPSAP